nr:hypothetical protein [Streptomyces sp. SID4948]
MDSASAVPAKPGKSRKPTAAHKAAPPSPARKPVAPAKAVAGKGSSKKPPPPPPAHTNRPAARSVTSTAAKAKPGPVGSAVKKLAASSPGRHICYRAYVVGIGWQQPVCDGAMAGTTGQTRAIEAIDIAVSGVSGTAANGMMQGPGWQTSVWPSAPDDTDLVIGVPGGSEVMQGFAINVGSGTVCQTAHVQNEGWHGQGCDTAGGYIFGGTLNGANWLEAVKFTV